MTPHLQLTKAQIREFRRAVNGLDARLPAGRRSLERAAWAGLQDSMPRAAVLSIHARVEGTSPDTWEDPALVQVWGPRFSSYVVARRDLAVFTLGRTSANEARRRLGEDLARRVDELLAGGRMTYSDAGRALGVNPNQLRYAAATGTLVLRWEGAGKPLIWTVPRPDVSPENARVELARRYLHIFGPTTSDAFAKWAGIDRGSAASAFEALAGSLVTVRTPAGDAVLLASDEPLLRSRPGSPAPARLLPSGDAYFLLWGADRELLVEDPDRRNELWTSRVWPGAILADGEIVGVWRRSHDLVTIQSWRRLPASVRDAIEHEAESLPLPGVSAGIDVVWES